MAYPACPQRLLPQTMPLAANADREHTSRHAMKPNPTPAAGGDPVHREKEGKKKRQREKNKKKKKGQHRATGYMQQYGLLLCYDTGAENQAKTKPTPRSSPLSIFTIFHSTSWGHGEWQRHKRGGGHRTHLGDGRHRPRFLSLCHEAARGVGLLWPGDRTGEGKDQRNATAVSSESTQE